MDKLAGQIIDFYDDAEGTILRKRFPTMEALPEVIKTAELLSEDERERLREPLFALVLQNGEERMKKFACTDEANTMLSVMYLLDHAQNVLPEKATKTAAQNLVSACGTYEISPPEELVTLAGSTTEEKLSSFVDVTKLEAPTTPTDISHYCLTKEARYPLQSYDQVQKAVKYFDDHSSGFHPSTRREYSLNLTKRANDLGIPVGEKIEKYAADSYVDDMQLRAELSLRMQKTASEEHKKMYVKLFEKRASLQPGVFAHTLMNIDEQAGLSDYWDGALQDPYAASLMPKVAGYSYNSSQGYVDEEDLKRVLEYPDLLKKAFGSDFAQEFTKKPVAMFQALPEPEKNVIIKMISAAKKW